MGVVDFLTNMGLFNGQPPEFFTVLPGLAATADPTRVIGPPADEVAHRAVRCATPGPIERPT